MQHSFRPVPGQKKVVKSGNPEKPAAAIAASDEESPVLGGLFIEALKQKMVGNPQKAVLYLNTCLEMDRVHQLPCMNWPTTIMNNDLVSAASLLEKAVTISGK